MTNKIEDSPVKWLCEKLSKYDEEMLFLYQEEIKEAEQEKKLDPANPNLKKICTKVQQKYAESTQQEQQEEARNKQEKSNEI